MMKPTLFDLWDYASPLTLASLIVDVAEADATEEAIELSVKARQLLIANIGEESADKLLKEIETFGVPK